MKKDITIKDLDYFSNHADNKDLNIYSNNENLEIKFDIEIPSGNRYNQGTNNLCWMYSSFNMILNDVCKNLNMKEKDFTFSSSYLAFYHYLEQSNSVYQRVIDLKTTDKNKISRDQMIKKCLNSCATFLKFRALINKYGFVPSSVMPDKETITNPENFRFLFNNKMMGDALKLSEAKKLNKNLYAIKKQFLNENYNILRIAFGRPPKKFSYEYINCNHEKVYISNITPMEFKNKSLKLNLNDFILLENFPKNNRKEYKKYVVKNDVNIYKKSYDEFINIPMKVLKDLVFKQLKDGIPVMCSCDSRKLRNKEKGIIDYNCFHLKEMNINILSKADSINFDMINYCHCLCIKGVKLDSNDFSFWKLENSYGNNNLNDGFYNVSDAAFEYIVFSVVINKKYITDKIKDIINEKPIVIK